MCVQYVFKKNIYFIIFPLILNYYYPMKGQIFVHFINKRSKGLTMQINYTSNNFRLKTSLIIFTKGADIFGHVCYLQATPVFPNFLFYTAQFND